jgi:hypothetical protein
LEAGFVDALAPSWVRRGGHVPSRVTVDLAVMLADGGEAIRDLAVLREQAELFGKVASDPTAWRVLKAMDGAAIARLRTARAMVAECHPRRSSGGWGCDLRDRSAVIVGYV